MVSSRVAVMLLVVTLLTDLLQGRPGGGGLLRCQPAVINRSVPGHQMSIKGLAVCLVGFLRFQMVFLPFTFFYTLLSVDRGLFAVYS